jgi:hypothetical protein
MGHDTFGVQDRSVRFGSLCSAERLCAGRHGKWLGDCELAASARTDQSTSNRYGDECSVDIAILAYAGRCISD